MLFFMSEGPCQILYQWVIYTNAFKIINRFIYLSFLSVVVSLLWFNFIFEVNETQICFQK